MLEFFFGILNFATKQGVRAQLDQEQEEGERHMASTACYFPGSSWAAPFYAILWGFSGTVDHTFSESMLTDAKSTSKQRNVLAYLILTTMSIGQSRLYRQKRKKDSEYGT